LAKVRKIDCAKGVGGGQGTEKVGEKSKEDPTTALLNEGHPDCVRVLPRQQRKNNSKKTKEIKERGHLERRDTTSHKCLLSRPLKDRWRDIKGKVEPERGGSITIFSRVDQSSFEI